MLSIFKQIIIEKKRFENCLLLPNTGIYMPYMEKEICSENIVKL